MDFESYAALDTGDFIIDRLIGGLTIEATQGFCTIEDIYPTDDDRIYAIPGNYTVTMECVSEIEPLHGLRLTFPEEFYIVQDSRCTVGLANTRYICNAFNITNTIEIF